MQNNNTRHDDTVKRNNVRNGNLLTRVNITLLCNQKTMTNDNDTLQSLSQHRIKLSKLQAKLEEINNSSKGNNQNFFS